MKYPSRSQHISALALSLICASFSASAEVTVYSDRTSFQQAAGPIQTIDFENFALGPLCTPFSPYIPEPCVLDVGNVSFVSTIGIPPIIQRPLLSINSAIGAPLSQALFSNMIPIAPEQFFFTFFGPSVALDIVSANEAFGSPVTALLSGGGADEIVTVTAVMHEGTFLGFTGLSSGFHQMSLYSDQMSGATNFLIDNVSVAVRAVPEPEALALMLVGLAGVGIRLRRRSRR